MNITEHSSVLTCVTSYSPVQWQETKKLASPVYPSIHRDFEFPLRSHTQSMTNMIDASRNAKRLMTPWETQHRWAEAPFHAPTINNINEIEIKWKNEARKRRKKWTAVSKRAVWKTRYKWPLYECKKALLYDKLFITLPNLSFEKLSRKWCVSPHIQLDLHYFKALRVPTTPISTIVEFTIFTNILRGNYLVGLFWLNLKSILDEDIKTKKFVKLHALDSSNFSEKS